MPESHGISRLLEIMKQLRAPNGGCAWDIAQTYRSIVPHTIEEAYEVAEAVERDDRAALRDELGDLLLQVVFLSIIAEEEGVFTFSDVATGVCDKMRRRHPHIFNGSEVRDWEDMKAEERRNGAKHGALDDVAYTLPALTRAAKLCKRAARTGFDWDDPAAIFDKIGEELEEVRAEMAERNLDRLEDEIGDVLFTTASFARKLGLDPEACLQRSNRKFISRFSAMEAALAVQGQRVEEKTLPELEALWQSVKRVLEGRPD